MRVVIDYRSALRERSGVGEYAYQLVRALLDARLKPSRYESDPADSSSAKASAERVDATIFSSSWKDRLHADELTRAGATIVDRRLPVRVLNFAWHRLGWPPVELLTGARYDVTHSLHPLIMPATRAAQVITIHDLNFLTHPERTGAEIRRDYPALAREHAHRADRIIVPSGFTAREVERRLEVEPDRIAVCSPGAPDWTPRAVPPADGYVLFFGTLEPRKNLGALLDAYERLLARRPALPTLVVAGKATGESAQWLDRIARPPLARIVRRVGYVDPSRRRELYEGARLLVQPSHEEGFGIPVLEAMTLGVPVVAADRGALPEVLGDAGALVDSGAPDALASAIERMLDDEAYAAACAAKGEARAKRFNWAQTAERVVEAYRLAMEHRACASA